MAFTEKLKEEVRRKAHFCCVVCGHTFVDIHHIVPEKDGGLDTADNAVPLCAGCHALYGNNPDFRKQIRGKRDLWYEMCAKRYENPDYHFFVDQLAEMRAAMDRRDHDTDQKIKTALLAITTRAGEKLRTANDFETVSATSGYVGVAVAWATPSVAGVPEAGHFPLVSGGDNFVIEPSLGPNH